MSTASKVTLGASCLFAVSSFVFINYNQRLEREALRQGPIKDAARLNAKSEELSKKQRTNELEHREQTELREKYESLQPLSSTIITADDND